VRLHFQARPVDLYFALGYAVVVSAFIALTRSGNPLGLLLVAVIPGYLAMAALLPRAESADLALRVALASGLSLALVAFLGIIVNFTPWGITLDSIVVSLLALSLILGGLAYARRMRIPSDQRLEMTIRLRVSRWAEYSSFEKGLALVLAASLAIVVPALGISLMSPRPTPPFTELYLLSPSGNLTGYPLQLNVSATGTVIIVVANHEGSPTTYAVDVHVLGLASRYNATSGQNETVVVNDTVLKSYSPFVLADGGTWEQPFPFSIASPGKWELNVLLYRGTSSGTPYRETDLLVNVRP
jgi:uncharacterized membrane protein